VRLLLYENGDYGLRHIFIEEAAEFVPQRVGPDQGRVYAEIEKLARMGGNALLGYTLINQRAEEVNKAVLELCDCLFLHRQKGRNSLTALGKWLDIGSGIIDTRPIIASLPTLPQGECYIWPAGTESPVHAKIPQKNTFHPDRRATQTAASQSQNYKALDVSTFVTQMSGELEEHLAQVKENDPAELKKEIARLRRELSSKPQIQPEVVRVEVPIFKNDEMTRLEEAMKSYTTVSSLMASAILDVTKALATAKQVEDARHRRIPASHRTVERVPAREASSSPDGLSAPQQRILDAIAWMESVHLLNPKRTVIAFLAGQSPKSSGFKNNLSTLRSLAFIRYVGNDSLEFTEAGRAAANILPVPITAEELQRTILARLPRPQSRILSILIEAYPHSIDRTKVADDSGQSPNSSGFKNNLSSLRSLGVLEYDGVQSVKALPVLFWNNVYGDFMSLRLDQIVAISVIVILILMALIWFLTSKKTKPEKPENQKENEQILRELESLEANNQVIEDHMKKWFDGFFADIKNGKMSAKHSLKEAQVIMKEKKAHVQRLDDLLKKIRALENKR